MNITLNGQSYDVRDCSTIRELLVCIDLGDRPVVVETNKRALLPKQHATTVLSEGDVVEVVQITAGG
jgi:sulfur carrier protein